MIHFFHKTDVLLPAKVVVELSRNQTQKKIVFVGEKKQAAQRLWDTLCKADQWTMLTESIVENLSVTANDSIARVSRSVVDVADTFPWRISDQWIPTANSGVVYLLISTPQPEQMYVGTTENLAVRMKEHNRGYGAEGTACPDYLPWAVAAYMTNMAHLTRSERYSIEAQWQELNQRSLIQRRGNLEQMIENGRTILNEHNRYHANTPDREITYVVLAQRRFALENVEEEGNS